jgi:predicted HAD superfamily Cof-like phosphohydrolase
MSLDDAVCQVRQFHRHIGAPVGDRPDLLRGDPTHTALLGTDLLKLSLAANDLGGQGGGPLLARLAFTLEELAEWLFAHARGDLAAAADAWADRLYVLLGDAVAVSLPAAALFAEIHSRNMTKEVLSTSWQGKGLKGAEFRPPDVRRVLKENARP